MARTAHITDVELGRRLRAIRFIRELTMREVEGQIGLPPTTLSRWERGKLPPLDRLQDLLDVYDVSLTVALAPREDF